MYLWLQVVEDGHAVLARDKGIDEMRADVAGAAGHEYVSDCHALMSPLGKHADQSHMDVGQPKRRAIFGCVPLVLVRKEFDRMARLGKRDAIAAAASPLPGVDTNVWYSPTSTAGTSGGNDRQAELLDGGHIQRRKTSAQRRIDAPGHLEVSVQKPRIGEHRGRVD